MSLLGKFAGTFKPKHTLENSEEQYKQEVQKLEKKHNRQKVKAAARNRKTFIKIYNQICSPCKGKLARDPGLDYKHFCDKCRHMIDGFQNNLK